MARREVHAVVLAAGTARRMGSAKQLALMNGVPMLQRTVTAVARGELDGIIVVLPPNAGDMRAAVAAFDCQFIVNPRPDSGLLSSLKAGLAALPLPMVEGSGVMIVLADQPLVCAEDYARLAAAFRAEQGKKIIRPTFGGVAGNPVTLPATLVAEVLAEPDSDRGAAFLFARYPQLVTEVSMDNDGVLFDVDTPHDLSLVTARLAASATEESP